jgi:hypothetical protein
MCNKRAFIHGGSPLAQKRQFLPEHFIHLLGFLSFEGVRCSHANFPQFVKVIAGSNTLYARSAILLAFMHKIFSALAAIRSALASSHRRFNSCLSPCNDCHLSWESTTTRWRFVAISLSGIPVFAGAVSIFSSASKCWLNSLSHMYPF